MEYYIGIDIGTSSVKLVLMNQDGTVLQQENREYKIETPYQGWKEIDPAVWMRAVKQGMHLLLSDVDSKSVRAIGITGQMHTTVFMDEGGSPVRPAIMWNDTRTKNLVPGLKEKLMKQPEMESIWRIISTGSPAANLLWLKEQEPENFARVKKFLIGPDYLVYCFTGKYGTDYCEASTSSLYDLKKREWSPYMQKLIGLPEDVYPVIRGSAQMTGCIKEEIASEFCLRADVIIIAGTGDNPAASISTGCLVNRCPVLSLGTSGVLMFPKETIDFEAKGKHILFSIDNKEVHTLVQGVVQSAGNSYSWWINYILKSTDFDRETSAIDLSKLGEGDLIFYPHLVGDKTIYGDPQLRGAFLGLGTDVNREDMSVAVMEGICFGVKELTEAMKLSKEDFLNIKVTGGGGKSKIWMQILADVLETKVEQLDGNIGAAFGAALLAGYSFRGRNSLLNIPVTVKESYLPREYNAGLYHKKYQKYKKVYQAMKLIYE